MLVVLIRRCLCLFRLSHRFSFHDVDLLYLKHHASHRVLDVLKLFLAFLPKLLHNFIALFGCLGLRLLAVDDACLESFSVTCDFGHLVFKEFLVTSSLELSINSLLLQLVNLSLELLVLLF